MLNYQLLLAIFNKLAFLNQLYGGGLTQELTLSKEAYRELMVVIGKLDADNALAWVNNEKKVGLHFENMAPPSPQLPRLERENEFTMCGVIYKVSII